MCYHTVLEPVAMGGSLTTHINGDENPTDFLTKVMYSAKRRYIVNDILHDMCNGEFKPHAVAK